MLFNALVMYCCFLVLVIDPALKAGVLHFLGSGVGVSSRRACVHRSPLFGALSCTYTSSLFFSSLYRSVLVSALYWISLWRLSSPYDLYGDEGVEDEEAYAIMIALLEVERGARMGMYHS
jgi:hypothetical protein